MLEVAVSSGSQLAADAGARVAEQGGNAVDAAIAASLVSCVVEPGVCSLAASGFLTIWPPGEAPVMVDGAAVMPGMGLPQSRFGKGAREVHLEYGGGMHTTVGPGSVVCQVTCLPMHRPRNATASCPGACWWSRPAK